MNKLFVIYYSLFCLILMSIPMVSTYEITGVFVGKKVTGETLGYDFSNDYGVEWQMDFGSDSSYGARYEGPQPIGDCDNDGENELLVGGRDSRLRVFEWDENKQTFLEMHTLRNPFYPMIDMDAGGFAIGDLTGDGENEIAATWDAAVYKWKGNKYNVIGWDTWIFQNGGGSADCYIGDCDNDGVNELVMSGGPMIKGSPVPEIMVYQWNGFKLVKDGEWKNPSHISSYRYVYMASVADVDDDGENEIVCGSAFKVFVLDWNKENREFETTVIKNCDSSSWQYPFACVCKDSDMDGKNEIHIGYSTPEISVFEWNGTGYSLKFEKKWDGEKPVIEALDVGDADNDGIPEVCAGTNLIHILQWNGSTYVEENVLPTFGTLAVLNIGDCDNDGENEIHAGSVWVDPGEDFMSWIFKYGYYNPLKEEKNKEEGTGSLKVIVKQSIVGLPLDCGSVAAWNLENKIWYDIPAVYGEKGVFYRNNLPAGGYLLRVTMEGYTAQETNIDIVDGEETSHTFTLQSNHIRNIMMKNHIGLCLFNKFLQKIVKKS
ncbi:MAG: hypothetical protein DRM98_01555 [Thermoplasmata archaeon]|nr:MAG: hypothetical protein DRM98_01555 [Thermoplasmata archaeon]